MEVIGWDPACGFIVWVRDLYMRSTYREDDRARSPLLRLRCLWTSTWQSKRTETESQERSQVGASDVGVTSRRMALYNGVTSIKSLNKKPKVQQHFCDWKKR